VRRVTSTNQDGVCGFSGKGQYADQVAKPGLGVSGAHPDATCGLGTGDRPHRASGFKGAQAQGKSGKNLEITM
jgi:hypothetical protein